MPRPGRRAARGASAQLFRHATDPGPHRPQLSRHVTHPGPHRPQLPRHVTIPAADRYPRWRFRNASVRALNSSTFS